MTSLWIWALVGMILYTLVAMALSSRGYLPNSVSVAGPRIQLYTTRGRLFLDRMADRERLWRAWGSFGAGVALVVMVLAGIAVLLTVTVILNEPEGAAIENPQNVLVIPGVNDFLPLNAAVEITAGLALGLIVHEGGHGLLCRVEDIGIETMGLEMLSFIPLGAFVQADRDDLLSANRGAQIRMYAAGIANNFALTVIVLVILVGPVLSSIAVAPGTPVGNVFPGSGAEEAGIEQGDVVSGIDGTAVENESEFESALWGAGDTVTVEFREGEERTVDRRPLIIGSVAGIADDVEGEDPLTRIERVNDTAVDTERDILQAVGDRPVAIFRTDRGNVTLPVGAFVAQVDDDGPLAAAGAPTDGTPLVVTHVDGERTVNATTLSDVTDRYDPGESADIVAYVADGDTFDRTVFEVTVDGDDEASLGVQTQDGYGGILVDDFGVDPYPADRFLNMISGDAIPDGVGTVAGGLVYILQLLILPFMALLDPSIVYSFPGFTPDVTSFFVLDGPLSFMGSGLFTVANLLFWTGWINFNVAIFNCIPALPLDGGHILRVSAESGVSRLPVSNGRRLATAVTLIVTLLMIAALVALLFGPIVL